MQYHIPSLFILAVMWPVAGYSAAYCTPPITPPPTSEALAREFGNAFTQDFEIYFTEAQRYLICIEQERREVMAELRETAKRYNRFLGDKQIWDSETLKSQEDYWDAE